MKCQNIPKCHYECTVVFFGIMERILFNCQPFFGLKYALIITVYNKKCKYEYKIEFLFILLNHLQTNI